MAAPARELFDLAKGRPITAGEPGLSDSAFEHRLSGLLVDAVEDGQVSLPAEEAKALTLTDMVTIGQHHQLWRSLNSVVSTLTQAGLHSFAIKGVAEEARWYGRIGHRPCSDVDLVVVPNDLSQVDEVLDVLCPDHPERAAISELTAAKQLQHIDLEWEGSALDLHFDPLKIGIWAKQVELFVETATTVEGPDGSVVPVFAPELALVGFLTHLNKDRFAYLGAYVDVARIATSPDLNWDLVERFVVGEGLEIPVWKSLDVVAKTLELDIDVPAVSGWRAELWDRLWPESIRLLGHEGRTTRRQRQAWLPMLTSGRWPEVVTEARRRLVPPKALLDLHTPDLQHHSLLRRLTVDRIGGVH